jgi:hypothetical protein
MEAVNGEAIAPPPFYVVGIYSPASQSGKTTAALYLQNAFGLVPVSFAEPLKRLALRFILEFSPHEGMAESHYWARQYFEHKERRIVEIPGEPCLRDILEAVGNGLRERANPDVWVAIAKRAVTRLQLAGRKVAGLVFDDVRFDNEAAYIKSLGGVMMQITRPGALPPDPRLQAEGLLRDYSFDATLLNIGNKSDFFRLVTGTVADLFGISPEPAQPLNG